MSAKAKSRSSIQGSANRGDQRATTPSQRPTPPSHASTQPSPRTEARTQSGNFQKSSSSQRPSSSGPSSQRQSASKTKSAPAAASSGKSKADRPEFSQVMLAIHGFLEALERISELKTRIAKHPNHADNAKLKDKVKKLEEKIEAARGDLDALKSLDQKDKHGVSAFGALQNSRTDNNKELTLLELEARFELALSQAGFEAEEMLQGWTLAELFRRVDRDHSGKVSMGEWEKSAFLDKKAWSAADSEQGIKNYEEKHRVNGVYADDKIDNMLNSWEKRQSVQQGSSSGSNQCDVAAAQEKLQHQEAKEMYECTHEKAVSKMLKAQFKKWDKDNDGLINKAELGKFLMAINPCLSEQEIDLLFNDIDKNGDGSIQFEEFVNYIFLTQGVA